MPARSSWPVWLLLVVVLAATVPTAADLTQELVYEQQMRQLVVLAGDVAARVYHGGWNNYVICCVRTVEVDGGTRYYLGALGRYTRLRWLEAR